MFVCVLSKKALGNFEKLEKGSPPLRHDNVLLEHHLALELLKRDMLHKVFPLVLADSVSEYYVFLSYLVGWLFGEGRGGGS